MFNEVFLRDLELTDVALDLALGVILAVVDVKLVCLIRLIELFSANWAYNNVIHFLLLNKLRNLLKTL